MEEVDLPKCRRVGTQNVVDFAATLTPSSTTESYNYLVR